MELKYLEIKDFKPETKLVKRIMFKPKTAPVSCIVIGLGLLVIAFITKKGILLLSILGIFFILMAISVIAFVKDHPVLDIYENGCLVYNSNDATKVVFIDFDIVDMWKPERDGGNDKIIFIFNDGSKLPISTFHANKIYKILDSLQHEKLERVVKARKSEALIATNPIENIKNIFKKKEKKNDED